MDDPWDVKSVRQSGHYTSCMKLNGVPLLPPLLSKECRKEMKYYKLLAKEVENRISLLQPYIDTDSSHSSEDKTDAPEIPECDQDYEIPKRSIAADFDLNIDHIDVTKEKNLDETLTGSSLHTELYNISSEQVVLQTADKTSQQLIIDFNVNISDTGRDPENKERNSPSLPIEVPERDYNCTKQRELLTDVETKNARCKKEKDKIIEDFVNFSVTVAKNKFTDLFSDNSSKDGIQSLSSKTFTGSLNNIHTESAKSVHSVSKLVRQRSYTVLNPSPQLLAHLEVQSLNLGVEMSCISMSDSLSNLSTPNKKRRSWDLESAKVKWSNMALELKQKNLGSTNNRNMKGQPTKRSLSPPVARSVALDRTRRSSLSLKPTPKTEPIHKIRKHSPLRSIPSNTTIILEELPSCRSGKEDKFVKSVKEPTSPKAINHKKETHEPISPKTRETSKVTSHTKKEPQASKSPENITIKVREVNKSSTPKPQSTSASGDPAAKVRELYEKIKKQQLVQMASLVEKQKREQLLLQQVFEEQNNLLFKQLKTICPKSPVEAKEAWADKTREPDRGPVSLSQLINPKSPEAFNSPLSSTLTESNKYISHCEDVLKKSRDISGSIKKTGKAQVQNGSKVQSPKNQLDSRTRTNSPTRRSTPTSRRLNYDTSASSDHEPILTDRTNDTMADLNVTFPSDSEECQPYSQNGTLNHLCGEEVTVIHTSPTPRNSARSTDSAIKCMEQTIQNSINSSYPRRSKAPLNHQPTLKQQTAASKIVAYAKGYLVRRLMKTARVQSTVQTIKDALLCALQLHQDREGIRGADVDLHRRLIQQITAACYSLHDTFIASTASERCAVIAADRGRRSSLANRPPPPLRRHSDIMSQSHSGVFAPRPKRFSSSSASLMTQSNYETYSSEKAGRARYMPSPWRRPWR